MRRGYKSWCESISTKYRATLGLALHEALEPTALANHLGVLVWHPEDVPGLSSSSLQQLTVIDGDSWSAVTLSIEGTNLMIVNSAHAPNRQRSSLAHELAHVILKHKPGRVDISEAGHLLLNSFDKEQEDEADWLAGALLVPREGLLHAYRQSTDTTMLCNQFGVSNDLLQWRLRMTGVKVQASRGWANLRHP